MQWEVGKREMKGKKKDRKFSPGQTNKNSLIPRLSLALFFVMNVSRPLFPRKRPDPKLLSPCANHSKPSL